MSYNWEDDEDLTQKIERLLGEYIVKKEKIPSLNWSPQQQQALTAIQKWLVCPNGKQVFKLFGYAGTGKTTLARYIADNYPVAFGAYTGKAASVMRKCGCNNATTIDRLIYTPRIEVSCIKIECEEPCQDLCEFKREKHVGRVLNTFDSIVNIVKLVIIDECSMVNFEMAQDLLSFRKLILVLGDPGQLPPIEGGGYFTDDEPDILLTEIHRQAENSPVIKLATQVREGNTLVYGRYGDSLVTSQRSISYEEAAEYDQILCGTHNTRCRVNNKIRQIKGYTGPLPLVGEKLVALKNIHSKRIYNGTIWTVMKIEKEPTNGFIKMMVLEDDVIDEHLVEVESPVEGFLISHGKGAELPGIPFTFSYALTVHKSQGSQWDSVCVIDDSSRFAWMARKTGVEFDKARWLYTAITRAANRVAVAK